MSVQSPEPTTNADPYRRLFEREYAQLERVRELIDNPSINSQAMASEIGKMANSYESLIRQAMRLTRAGDRIGHQLNVSRKELERRNRILIDQAAVRDELISVTAHDLQNPLGAIVGMVEMLHDELRPAPASLESDYLGAIDESARHLLHLVNDLLAISRIERGALQLQSQLCVLGDIIEVLRPKYQALAERKKIRLEVSHGLDPFPVRGDASALRRIMENLISNAVKFCLAGCVIRINIDYTQPDLARVSVIDDGPGITPEDQAQLFQPYGLTRNRPTGGELSTGLGLSIAKQLIDAMGGCIWCDATPGEGSAFYFEINRFNDFEVED
ncbi:MAG: sensor histidine kinase [Puniceicoccales bacterium]